MNSPKARSTMIQKSLKHERKVSDLVLRFTKVYNVRLKMDLGPILWDDLPADCNGLVAKRKEMEVRKPIANVSASHVYFVPCSNGVM